MFLTCRCKFEEIEKDRSQNWHLYGCSPVCVLRCLVRLADLGNVLPQYLHPYLSLFCFPMPPPPAPAAPNIAFNVFCTGSSRLELNCGEVKEDGGAGPEVVYMLGVGNLKLFSNLSYMARWLGARLGEGGYLYGRRERLSQTRE